jgi:hypothetical protein
VLAAGYGLRAIYEWRDVPVLAQLLGRRRGWLVILQPRAGS